MTGSFFQDHIVSIIFGCTTLVTSGIALHYQRLEHRRRVEKIVIAGKRVGLFLSREAMIRYLLEMYDRAEAEDVIWAQCVRCANFSPAVRNKILKAAGNQVRFRMIINKYSPSLADFKALFTPVHGAELAEGPDNAISMQGLSEREVVIAFPDMDSYTAILVRDPYFTRMMKHWFDQRFDKLQSART